MGSDPPVLVLGEVLVPREADLRVEYVRRQAVITVEARLLRTEYEGRALEDRLWTPGSRGQRAV